MLNLSGGRKRILSPFTGRKKRKARNKTREKYMTEEKIQNLAATDKGYYNQGEWLEEFFDNKGAIDNGTKQPPEVFCKKRCSEKFSKFHRKTPVLESPFIKVAGLRFATLLKRDSNIEVFSCEICEIFKNTY